MPVSLDVIKLKKGTVQELHDALSLILLTEQNPNAPVRTEVGLHGGRTFVGALAMNLRVEFGGRVVISADEVR